jgi:hypothetical protein
MTSRRAPFLRSLALPCVVVVAGCAHQKAQPAAAPQAAVPAPILEEAPPREASLAQRHAQKAWCSYLETLYHRATTDETPWSQSSACNEQRSSAKPEMLERTAACSREALASFPGDPFTAEYAMEVKRCGTDVIESLSLDAAKVEPYVSLVCQRQASCGASDPASCHAELTSRFGKKLGRAVGIINEDSRAELRRCLQNAACQEAGDQIGGCLEPILERLLWTPE